MISSRARATNAAKRRSKTMRTIPLPNEVYERLEQEVWDIATDDAYLPEWWDTTYVTPSGERFFVCACGDDEVVTRKVLTKRQLVVAYLSIETPTHCGGYHIIHSPDSCSADLILQQALFGSQVYG
tara:strand:+ start:210 stop:587 length:378 start_codon:yes stop_codon:yes gene_type:complete